MAICRIGRTEVFLAGAGKFGHAALREKSVNERTTLIRLDTRLKQLPLAVTSLIERKQGSRLNRIDRFEWRH